MVWLFGCLAVVSLYGVIKVKDRDHTECLTICFVVCLAALIITRVT